MTADAPPKPRRGCFFYGCLTGVVCLVAILVAFLLGLHQLRRMVNEYTDSQPAPLPTVQMPQAELDAVQRRVDAFVDAIRNGRATPPLALTSDEINALLGALPQARPWKGKLYVSIAGGQLRTQVSVPLSELGLPIFRGRYLNGTGTVALGIANGILSASLQSLTVKGKPVPPLYMDRIRVQNLAAGLNDPANSAALNRLQAIEIKDDKLVFVPKAN